MLSRIHPLPKLVVCLVWIAASVLVFDLIFQLLVIGLAILILIGAERRSPLLVLALAVPFALFGFGFLTTSVLFRQDADFALLMEHEQALASPAVSAGLVLFFRAIACGMVSAVFALTTDPGSLVKAMMVQWRLPPQIGFALFQAMQMVPDLAREAQQARLARAMQKGRPPRRVPGPFEALSLVVPLLAYAIRRAGRSAIAMEARGLTRNGARTWLEVPEISGRDRVFVVSAAAVLVACLTIIHTI